jgi:hypothetical protein
MILLESRDKQIWHLEKKTIEIVNDAISTTGPIIISLGNEGPCLRSCNFYNILDDISQTFNINKNRFIIQTCNVEEYHDEYSIEIQNNIWVNRFKKTQTNNEVKNSILHTVGCFIGKTNWNRLVLLGWLDKFFNEKSLLTCHYNNNSQSQLSALQLNEIFQICPDEIHNAINFLKTCPKKITNIDMQCDNKKITFDDIVSITNELSSSYYMIFSELVCETYYSGITFFPTEKTFRPIMQLTPTITFGPRGFLSNMQRCGFKTFLNYWDESYDDLQGHERIQAIQVILKKLFLLDQTELKKMYNDMLPILQHNKNRLLTMTPQELKLVA